jgi:hypothetical protein
MGALAIMVLAFAGYIIVYGGRGRLCPDQKRNNIWSPFHLDCRNRTPCRAGHRRYLGLGACYNLGVCGQHRDGRSA